MLRLSDLCGLLQPSEALLNRPSPAQTDGVTGLPRGSSVQVASPSTLVLRDMEWGAVYADIDLDNREDAVDLARTITLLQPDSKAVSAAYIVALVRAINTPGKEQERKKEVEDRLKRLLESNPDESQLEAVRDALALSNDREDLDLLGAAAEARFPKNVTFAERRRLEGYLVASLPHLGQTGD
jgi:hypothetical protein